MYFFTLILFEISQPFESSLLSFSKFGEFSAIISLDTFSVLLFLLLGLRSYEYLSFFTVSKSLRIFSFSTYFMFVLRLGNFIALTSSLLLLSFVISTLLLSLFCEVFSWLLYFSVFKFPFGLKKTFYFSTENFYFICFKRTCNCLLSIFTMAALGFSMLPTSH